MIHDEFQLPNFRSAAERAIANRTPDYFWVLGRESLGSLKAYASFDEAHPDPDECREALITLGRFEDERRQRAHNAQRPLVERVIGFF